MASRPMEAATGDVGESLVACSPDAWAKMTLQSQSVSADDPPSRKNTTLEAFGIQELAFSAGPDLTLEDYLRLRVLWHSWPDQTSFAAYTPGNPAALNDSSDTTPQTGYISPENVRIADTIYNALKPTVDGYLDDIRRVGDGDPTMTSRDLTGNILHSVRYTHGLLSIRDWGVYDEDDKKTHFRGKVSKTEADLPEDGDGTPALDAGDAQYSMFNDQNNVDRALYLMLQTVTALVWSLRKETSPALAAELSKVGGMKHLDWLPDHLLLHLIDRSPGPASPQELITARTDGYLCRRDFVQASDDDESLKPNFNRFPLVLLDGKPFRRLSALPGSRWQESAEMAAWVSELDDRYEKVGLLHSSKSGRKRRLLISQGRDELWIIIAEYGDEWKQYVRGMDKEKSIGPNQARGAGESVSPEGSVSTDDPDPQVKLPGPEDFCTMQEWGPYNIGVADHMECFIRRLIGFEVELVQNWPADAFEHPEPE